MKSQIRKIIVNEQEIIDPNIILNEIRDFYESLFKIGDSNPPSQKLTIFLIRFSFQN